METTRLATTQVLHLRFILCAPVPGCFTLRLCQLVPHLLPPHLLPPRLLPPRLLLHLRPRARRSAAQAQVLHLRFILCAPVPSCFTLRLCQLVSALARLGV